MTPKHKPDPAQAQRKRNIALGLALGLFAVLFYGISVSKMAL